MYRNADTGLVAAVEWTRLEGGQVEAVIAMFVNRDRPTSVRITPSRGDGGVDILDRGAGEGGTDVVYQVKRYTEKLTSKQKTEIKDSLTRLITDKRWQDLSVREWRLVTPWDPSPEAETWLQDLGYPELRKVWLGLTWADQQAAKYGDVVDYYLHGGRALVEQAHADVMALLGADRAGDDLSVPEVHSRLQRALQVLNHDPHYRYEHRFGEGSPPPYPKHGDRPGLVMHTQVVEPDDGAWSSVDIIARCAASVEERPITIEGSFTARRGSELAGQLDAFYTYGAPFASPEGSFDGFVDAPGGLGGTVTGAAVWVGPVADADLGDNPELHLEVLDPDGTSLAGVNVRRVERSRGPGGGVRVVLEEEHGLFSIEDRYDLRAGRSSRSVQAHDWTGKPVVPTHAGALFLSNLHSPNRLRFSVRHTPVALGLIDAGTGFDWGDDADESLKAVVGLLEALSRLQTHASTGVLVPDLAGVTRDAYASWQRAAALLDGEELVATYPEGSCVLVVLDGEVEFTEEQSVRILLPFQIQVGAQLIELGHHEAVLDNPTVLERRTEGSGVLHAFATPDRTVRWRRHDAS